MQKVQKVAKPIKSAESGKTSFNTGGEPGWDFNTARRSLGGTLTPLGGAWEAHLTPGRGAREAHLTPGGGARVRL